MEAPLYAIADALQLSIFFKDGGLVAHQRKDIHIGPWSVECPLRITTDQLELNEFGGFVKILKGVWLYMYSNALTNQLYCFVFDGKKVGIKTMLAVDYSTGHWIKTIEKLRPSITAAFAFKSKRWVACEINDLVGRQSDESVEGTESSPSP